MLVSNVTVNAKNPTRGVGMWKKNKRYESPSTSIGGNTIKKRYMQNDTTQYDMKRIDKALVRVNFILFTLKS